MLEKSRDETHHSTYSYNAESSTNYCNQYNQSSDFVSNKTFIDPPFKSSSLNLLLSIFIVSYVIIQSYSEI